jgi:hypothetical protein
MSYFKLLKVEDPIGSSTGRRDMYGTIVERLFEKLLN